MSKQRSNVEKIPHHKRGDHLDHNARLGLNFFASRREIYEIVDPAINKTAGFVVAASIGTATPALSEAPESQPSEPRENVIDISHGGSNWSGEIKAFSPETHRKTTAVVDPQSVLETQAGDANADIVHAGTPQIAIRPGDTLSEIAKEHDTSVDELSALNNIENPDLIFADDTLQLPDSLITHVVKSPEKHENHFVIAQDLGFNSVEEMVRFQQRMGNSEMRIEWKHKYPDGTIGPFLLLHEGDVLYGPGRSEVNTTEDAVTAKADEKSPKDRQQTETQPPPEHEPEPEPNSNIEKGEQQSEAEPAPKPDKKKQESVPQPEPEPKEAKERSAGAEPEHFAVLKDHYDAMNRYCGDLVPKGADKQKAQPEAFSELADGLKRAIAKGKSGQFLLELRNEQFKYIAQELSTRKNPVDFRGAISHCISGIADLENVEWDQLSAERQRQWLDVKNEFVEDVAEGASLHDVELAIEEAKSQVINAHNYLVPVIGELNQGLSDKLAAARAVRFMAGDSLRQIVIEEVEFVVNGSRDGRTANGLIGRSLVHILERMDTPVENSFSNEELQKFGQLYATGKVSFNTISADFEKNRSSIVHVHKLMGVNQPAQDRIDELATELLFGRDLGSIRKGLVEHRTAEESIDVKEVYKDVLGQNIKNKEVLDDEELIEKLVENLDWADEYDTDEITIDKILEAAEAGDMETLEELAAPQITTELLSGMTGAAIKEALVEKYGNGKSGNLHSDDLEALGDSWAGHHLYPDAAVAFRMLSEAFEREFGRPIKLTDSYRSYADQNGTKKRKGKWAAQPGFSNHGWGLAVDLSGGINKFGTKEHNWMRENAQDFGFVLPAWAHDGKGIEEPWHWEFVGKPIDAVIEEGDDDDRGHDDKEHDDKERDDKEHDDKEHDDKERDDKERPDEPEVKMDERLTRHFSKEFLKAEKDRVEKGLPTFEEAKDFRWDGPKGPMVPLRDIVILAANAGYRGEDLVTQVSISPPEAVGEYIDGELWIPLYITGDEHLGENSIAMGIFQIHNGYEAKPGDGSMLDPIRLMNPMYNAEIAKYKYDNGGFDHWTTFRDGMHIPYIDDARKAVRAVEEATGVDLGS